MKKYLLAVCVAAIAGAVLVPVAGAAPTSNKTLWHASSLDPIVTKLAGTSLTVVTSDNAVEWDAVSDGPGVLGFTCPTCGPQAPLYNPYDGKSYAVYHTVYIAPEIDSVFRDIAQRGMREGMNSYQVGMAMLTLDHEAMHWRLYSGDEGRVNACALADLPRLLTEDFNVPSTTTKSVSVPQSYRAKVRYRAKVGGRYIYRYRWVTRTRYVTQTQTVRNPVYWDTLSGAQAFYRDQPYPYNAGTC